MHVSAPNKSHTLKADFRTGSSPSSSLMGPHRFSNAALEILLFKSKNELKDFSSDLLASSIFSVEKKILYTKTQSNFLFVLPQETWYLASSGTGGPLNFLITLQQMNKESI
jgi:hypothetical protein